MTRRSPTTETYIVLRTILSAGVLVLLLLLACTGMAAGATWVVDDDGGAGVDYTTIQAAVDAANDGDTIEVRSGTYVENVNVNKQLTLIGEGADVVTVRAADSWRGVFEVRVDYMNISGFTATGAIDNDNYELGIDRGAGIYLSNADHCSISDNIASNNDCGIWLDSSSNNTLRNNAMSGNNHNFRVSSHSLSDYIQNIDTSNLVDGKPVYYLVDRHNEQVPNNAGYVGVVNSTNIIVRDLTLTDNVQGVLLAYTTDSTIENVVASNNDCGIFLDHSDDNTLTGNNASNNWNGIILQSSSNNILTDNTANSNNDDSGMCPNYGILLDSSSNYNTLTGNNASNNDRGIWLGSSSNNTLRNNAMSGNNYNFGVDVYGHSDHIQNIDTSNLVDGKPVYYWVDRHNEQVPSDAGYVGVVDSTNVIVRDLTLTDNGQGVLFAYTTDSKIENVTVSDNRDGIFLESSSYNMLTNNIADSNSWIGIWLESSDNNTLTDNTASNDYYGIYIGFSSYNTLTSNNASNNWGPGGIGMWSASYNTLTGNSASNNDGSGIDLSSSNNNILYHNNLNNAYDDSGTNQWDSGSEGNHYGGDYTSTDSDGDGIGDTPYLIPGGSSEDRYPLMAPYTPPTGPQNKSLVQVEGRPEVYWFQNNRLYWVTDWDVINDMTGVPGWDSVNTLPASEFDPATYPQGPRFITTGAESNDLLIREQGAIKVYLILNGEKHHFTSPEALTWNGYGFDDVIEVSSTIVGMFPEGTPISIQEKHLLRKPGETHVFWSQNGELYYVTADALDKMLDIHSWGWDEINEPTDFNPEDPSHYKTFITTDPESNGVLIRLWDGYKVYRIEDGFRRHITYPEVMELKGYVMEDVIDVSQDIVNMFLLGDPIGIEVNLTFNKTTDSGEETCTKFTTGETVKFYTETTVSESYTVDTYVKLIEPDGRTRYAYHTDPDFQPTDQLSFSDTEVPLYPGHWDAISKNWHWHEYTFTDDVEGVYTWEFYYKDVISGKVLGWDRKSYVFAKKTDLGLELTISTNKDVYGENEPIIIFADVHDLNGNDVVVNKFEVSLDNFPQEFEFEQVCSIYGNYEITGLKAPGPSLMGHKIDVSVVTGAGNAFDTKTIHVGGYTTYTVLMMPVCPKDWYDSSSRQPTNLDGWYETKGTPEWYGDVAKQAEKHYRTISYDQVHLDITTADRWFVLDEDNEDYSPRYSNHCKKSIDKAKEFYEDFSQYDILIVLDPALSYGPDWTHKNETTGKLEEHSGCMWGAYDGKQQMITVSTPYQDSGREEERLMSVICHEITHVIDDPAHGIDPPDHGDNHGGPCIMGSGMEGMVPFCPVCGQKLGFSSYTEVSPPGFWSPPLVWTLYPVEGGPNRAINFSKTRGGVTYYYWVEFRSGSWQHATKSVILWRSGGGRAFDHPMALWINEKEMYAIRYDLNTHLLMHVISLSETSSLIQLKYATDVFTTANKVSDSDYNIEMDIIGRFFENMPFNFSVIDTLDQSEVFNSTLTTNTNGEFNSPITFTTTITDNIEDHPYLIRLHTASGWVPFLIATPSLIDGISNETPFFTASDPAETNTSGDLTDLTSTCGSMKLSLKTAMPVDTGSYRYVIYLDSDNSSSTGSIVNSIGADYKIEYSDAGAKLYRYNISWTLVDTPYLNASHNGTNIEILTTTEIMNGTDTVKLVAQTSDGSDTLHDTLPDPTATPPYLEFMDVHPMDLRFAEYGYYTGDNVTVNGYGFAQNQMIPITIMNQTGHVLWNGSVQADSDGQVINVSTYTVPDDFYGTAYLYWAGAQMDSFSRLTPPLPVYNAEFELDAPMVAGVGREFNVTVSFENIGDDLTNLTLNLNTSGMTSEPETVWIGDLASGQNYTYTWNLTPTCSGFALLKAEVCSNQSTFVTDQKGMYIANISVEIDAPNGTQCGSTVEFNVSVTNNQENITYTDLGINTSVKEIETNFTQPIIALPPGHTVNQSYLWDTANVTPGTYQIMVDIVSNGVVLSSGESSILVNFTPVDTTPPSSITNLHPTPAPTYLNWTWTNPPDPDFNHTEIYLDGVFQTINSAEHYNATDLAPETSYTISTRTVDTAGNINQTWVNDTATTPTLQVPPSAVSSSATGAPKDTYRIDEDVYAAGSGFATGTNVDIYVVQDRGWDNGDQIPADVTGSVETVSVVNGDVCPVLVWHAPLVIGEYDIVIDANRNGVYDASTDGLDSGSPGFVVIDIPCCPPVIVGPDTTAAVPTISPIGAIILVGLLGIIAMGRIRRRFN